MKSRRVLMWLGMLAALGSVSWYAAAQHQDKPSEKSQQSAGDKTAETRTAISVYRLDFVLSELVDGKKVNSRSYSVLAESDGKMNKLRSGARYPVTTQNDISKKTQFQYLDIGVNIDCRIDDQDGAVGLYAAIDSSSVSWPETGTAHSVPEQPVINQMRSEVTTLLRPGTPTMVSSMEDPASKRRLQVEVTATRVN